MAAPSEVFKRSKERFCKPPSGNGEGLFLKGSGSACLKVRSPEISARQKPLRVLPNGSGNAARAPGMFPLIHTASAGSAWRGFRTRPDMVPGRPETALMRFGKGRLKSVQSNYST